MNKHALLLIVVACVFWGTSGIFVHYLAPIGFSSINMTGARAFVAFLSMLLYTLLFNRQALKVKRKHLILSFCMGVAFFGTAGLYFTAMTMTSVSTAVVLMYTAPIYVTVYSVMFLGEKMTGKKLLSVIFVIVGCAMVSGAFGGMRFDPLGITLGVLSGVSYAAYNILTKTTMKCGAKPDTATLYCFLAASITAIFAADIKGLCTTVAKAPFVNIFALLLLGIVTCVIPYLTYTLALRSLPAGVASSLGIIEPMSATLFSVILFKEELDAVKIIGIAVILVAVMLLGREKE